MTFLLPKVSPMRMEARGNDTPIPTFWQGLGAAVSSTWITTNANFAAQRLDSGIRDGRARQVWDTLGRERAIAILEERGIPLDETDPYTDSIVHDRRAQAHLFAYARANPDAFPFDVSDEGMTGEATARLQAEYQNAQDMLSLLTPAGRVAADFLGGMVGMTADVRNVPFLAVGGGTGSILRVAGREASLNVAAEAVTMPSQFNMAERLDIPDPDVVQQLAVAAAAGGVLGGAVEALSRGLTYYSGTRGSPMPTARDPVSTQFLVDQAETAIFTEPRPIETVAAAVAADPITPPLPPLILRNPIPPSPRNPLRRAPPVSTVEATEANDFLASLPPVPLVGDAVPRSATEAPAGTVSADAAIAERNRDVEEATARVDALQEAFDHDFPAFDRHPYPFTRAFRARYGGIRTRDAAGNPSQAYQELVNRGVRTSRLPWLFNNRTGRADVDNLFDDVPEWIIPKADDGTYASREAIFDIMADEIERGVKFTTDPVAFNRLMEINEARGARRTAARTPQEAFLAKEQTDGGFFVDKTHYRDAAEFMGEWDGGAARIAKAFDEWFAQRYHPETRLMRHERDDILAELQANGGEADFLVERVLERNLDYMEGLDGPSNEAAAKAGSAGDAIYGNDIPWDEPAPRGDAPSGNGTGAEPATERTAAGDQLLAPGIAPVSERQRLEARQQQKLVGAARAADEGLFDLGARQQMDWLDQPTGQKAKPIMDQRTEDVRDLGDRPITLDGRETTVSQALADLDAGDDFADILDLCGTRTPTP